MTLWLSPTPWVGSSVQVAGENVRGISMETSGDPSRPHWSLMSEAAAHFVRYDPGDINSVKICCRQKVSLCSTEGQGEGEGEGG